MDLFVFEDGKPGPCREWIKSSFSYSSGNCVEVAAVSGGLIKVRDSMNPSGAVLRFGPAQWTAFVGGVRHGEFDRP